MCFQRVCGSGDTFLNAPCARKALWGNDEEKDAIATTPLEKKVNDNTHAILIAGNAAPTRLNKKCEARQDKAKFSKAGRSAKEEGRAYVFRRSRSLPKGNGKKNCFSDSGIFNFDSPAEANAFIEAAEASMTRFSNHVAQSLSVSTTPRSQKQTLRYMITAYLHTIIKYVVLT